MTVLTIQEVVLSEQEFRLDQRSRIRALRDQSPRRQEGAGAGPPGQAAARRQLPDLLRLHSIRARRSDRREFSILVDSLSTNLTKFFREDQHFEYLRSHLLPPASGVQAEPARPADPRLERGLLLGRGAVLHRDHAARSRPGPGPLGRQAPGDRRLHARARAGPGGPLRQGPRRADPAAAAEQVPDPHARDGAEICTRSPPACAAW